MQLTHFTDLGLRVLMYLAHGDRPEPIKIIEIAEQFDVPRNHLIKVANKLGHLGWVETLRGRNGGLRLSITPANLSIGKVLRELEGCTQLIDCEASVCALRNGCRLKGILDLGLDVFYREMNKYTLADIVAEPTGGKIVEMHNIYLREN